MCAMARTKETRVYKLIGRKWTPIMPIMWGEVSPILFPIRGGNSNIRLPAKIAKVDCFPFFA